MPTEEQKSLEWLSLILDTLRIQCPWDRAQTTDSLRYLTIEEVYELSEAILEGNIQEQRKELGDLFMHLLFYCKIAESQQQFNLVQVLDGICEKLISRHPHIALPDRNGVVLPAMQQQIPEWEKVKMREGRKSVLEGVPSSLPPLVKAVRMQEKVSGMGFKWSSSQDALSKVKEEYNELQEELQHETPNLQRIEEEYGDLLLALVCWGNMLHVNADDALAKANNKFQNRFMYVETQAQKQGKSIGDLTLNQMLELWQQAKNQ